MLFQVDLIFCHLVVTDKFLGAAVVGIPVTDPEHAVIIVEFNGLLHGGAGHHQAELTLQLLVKLALALMPELWSRPFLYQL